MSFLARWLVPAALAGALGTGALFAAPARADDDLTRVIVDVADIVFRSGQPYYRYSDGYNDRLIVESDYRGRPVYYRHQPRGNAYGYHRNRGNDSRSGFVRDPYGRYSRQRCDSRGRCRVEYYDPRYDRHGQNRDYSYDERREDDRYWDGHRLHDRD